MDDRGIVAEKLTRRFGQQIAVDRVDLDIASGQVFGFLGPNGAGKSTVIKILTTILAPTEGRARVAGFDVVKNGQEVRLRIGVALQEVGLDPLMTGMEMLVLQARLFGFSEREGRTRAASLMRTVGLEDVDPKKRSGEYSGGMRRRLDLALALVHDPRILFLDEPTTGLDPASRVAIWEKIRHLSRDEGITVFLTTQYLEEADRLADQVAIINNGQIVIKGTPRELKRAVGNEILTLTFDTSQNSQRASEVLPEWEGRQRLSGREVVYSLNNAATVIPKFVRILDEAHVPLTSLSVTQPTLDDVFLRATGDGSSDGRTSSESSP